MTMASRSIPRFLGVGGMWLQIMNSGVGAFHGVLTSMVRWRSLFEETGVGGEGSGSRRIERLQMLQLSPLT